MSAPELSDGVGVEALPVDLVTDTERVDETVVEALLWDGIVVLDICLIGWMIPG